MASKKPQEDNAPDTPAWIVSFTDMITLLLAFFVLLQAFAKEQDPELYRQGQGAFKRSVAGFGIPDLLFGKTKLISGPADKKRHPTKESDEKKKNPRVIDNKDAEIRQAFDQITKAIETKTSDARVDASNIESPAIKFAPGSASLNAEARDLIGRYAKRVGRNREPTRIVIVATAPDQLPGKARWMRGSSKGLSTTSIIVASRLGGSPL